MIAQAINSQCLQLSNVGCSFLQKLIATRISYFTPLYDLNSAQGTIRNNFNIYQSQLSRFFSIHFSELSGLIPAKKISGVRTCRTTQLCVSIISLQIMIDQCQDASRNIL
ncbi:Hypothetical_protein [Hexamita inflata]|uniref:Hypothetical_protein n=1 Tax=Hexamita inflata TaxID=28002 RepID=A0AA86RDI5_9EUKA|nr:Hypothetical protein HINF_LOCUS59650 [Hexamita inflata]CAI9972006.1 Hypothetical protein HINF_LOCUS59651 [Hexamita inflata]